MPYRAEAASVLAMWREIERQLRAAPAGSEEEAALLVDWARLRLEYQRLTELAIEHHRPRPEPWPESELVTDSSDVTLAGRRNA